jgi:hypothetical protein
MNHAQLYVLYRNGGEMKFFDQFSRLKTWSDALMTVVSLLKHCQQSQKFGGGEYLMSAQK